MRPFPVLRLNDAITEKIPEMTSIDIPGGIATGLDPEIRFVDEQGPITTVAEIKESPVDGIRHVTISAAFAQFLWLLSDITFRIHDSVSILTEFEQFSDKEKGQFISHLNDRCEESRYLKALFDWESIHRPTIRQTLSLHVQAVV